MKTVKTTFLLLFYYYVLYITSAEVTNEVKPRQIAAFDTHVMEVINLVTGHLPTLYDLDYSAITR